MNPNRKNNSAYIALKIREMRVALNYKRNFLDRIIADSEKFSHKAAGPRLAYRYRSFHLLNIIMMSLNFSNQSKELLIKKNEMIKTDAQLSFYQSNPGYNREILDPRDRDNGHILAWLYCVGLGLEIGGSACNEYGMNTKNLDIPSDHEKELQIGGGGVYMPIDYNHSLGEKLTFRNKFDYIIASHVLEHIDNPIHSLEEWYQALRPGGVLYLALPHKERSLERDKDSKRTTLGHLVEDYSSEVETTDIQLVKYHKHFWLTSDIQVIVDWMNKNLPVVWNIEERVDKLKNRPDTFLYIIRKAYD